MNCTSGRAIEGLGIEMPDEPCGAFLVLLNGVRVCPICDQSTSSLVAPWLRPQGE